MVLELSKSALGLDLDFEVAAFDLVLEDDRGRAAAEQLRQGFAAARGPESAADHEKTEEHDEQGFTRPRASSATGRQGCAFQRGKFASRAGGRRARGGRGRILQGKIHGGSPTRQWAGVRKSW